MFKKKFEKWIAKSFYGLSSYTLMQVLMDGMPKNMKMYADNAVYVSLYNVFCGKGTESERMFFDAAKAMVEAWEGGILCH